MAFDDSGINKPFDRVLKSLAEEVPVAFLRLMGMVPAEGEVEITRLRAETAPPVVLPDWVAVVRRGSSDEPRIKHLEFVATYYRELTRDLARYGGSLAWQYRMEVDSVAALLRPQGAPADIPEVGYFSIGRTKTEHPFRIVRMWEIDPKPVLESRNRTLLPLAVLMKSSDEQVWEIASVMGRQGDEEALWRFLVFGAVRYDRSSLEEMLGGGKMGLVRALLDASSLVQEVRDQARVEGEVRGEARGEVLGKAEGMRACIRHLVQRRFPSAGPLSELDGVSDLRTLEMLLDRVTEAADVESVLRAVSAAVARL